MAAGLLDDQVVPFFDAYEVPLAREKLGFATLIPAHRTNTAFEKAVFDTRLFNQAIYLFISNHHCNRID